MRFSKKIEKTSVFFLSLTMLSVGNAANVLGADSPEGKADTLPPVSASDIRSWINEKFGGLTLAAGPSTTGGFGATLKGDGRKIWGPFDDPSHQDDSDGFKLPVFPYLGYATDNSLSTKSGSLNHASIDLTPGLDGGVFQGAWKKFINPNGPPPTCTTNPDGFQKCSVPPPNAPLRILGYGLYGDFKYRYGEFKEHSKTKNVNQLLAGGGMYLVWQKGMDKTWIDVWPRLSLTYYTPVSTNIAVTSSDLPKGIKADYLQLEFKTGFNFGPRGLWMDDSNAYPFRLGVTYDGSQPTTGKNQAWQNAWNVQLSTDILGTKFKPAITFQSGKNGGLKYDKQILIGLVSKLF